MIGTLKSKGRVGERTVKGPGGTADGFWGRTGGALQGAEGTQLYRRVGPECRRSGHGLV